MSLFQIIVLVLLVAIALGIWSAASLINGIANNLNATFSALLGANDNRWDNTQDHRQAILDLASSVESMQDDIGRIESSALDLAMTHGSERSGPPDL